MYSSSYIKKILSFSSLCFFAPFVHLFLFTKDFGLSKKDKEFIVSYIKLGYLNIFYMLFLIGVYVLSLFPLSDFLSFLPLNYIYEYGVIPFIIVFILQIIFLLEGKEVKIGDIFNLMKTEGDLFDITKSYIPGYNFYLNLIGNKLYSQYFLKESLFLWTIFIVSVIFLPIIVGKIIFFIILFRIISLVVGYDFISLNFKKKINGLFENNLEEIRGTFVGSVLFIFDIFKKGIDKGDFQTYLNYAKNKYGQFYYKNNYKILVEYMILFLLIFYWVINDVYGQKRREVFDFYKYLTIIILVIKYIISLKQNKLTLIPIIHEIVHYLQKIILYFYYKILGK